MPISFSHHQKFVVVDTRIGFVGGLDLAVGRYESRAEDEGKGKGESRRGGTKILTFMKVGHASPRDS